MFLRVSKVSEPTLGPLELCGSTRIASHRGGVSTVIELPEWLGHQISR